MKSKRTRKKRVNTELHEALRSGGVRDRTQHLSDREFGRQLCDETKYMFRLSGSYFKRAGQSLCELLDALL